LIIKKINNAINNLDIRVVDVYIIFSIVFILKVLVWQTVNRMPFTVNRIKS